MRHISRLKSFVWYATVALLVLLAVLVTVARLTIGSVSEYRDRLEQLAGKYLGQPVTISNMDARLVGLKPTILFEDVSLREDETREQLAHFNSIGIALNPLSSLRHLSPIIDLTINGANIVVIQNSDGTFRLQGVTLSKQARNAESGGALGAWFLSQARLALEDSRVVWRNQATGHDIVFDGVNVELQNLQTRHRLNASVSLPQELGRELRLSLDIRGNLLNRKDWAGDLYVRAAQVRPARWISEFDYHGFRFTRGDIDVELWSRWEDGLLRDVQGEVALSNLALSRNGEALPLQRLASQVLYRHDSDGWYLALQRAEFGDGSGSVEPFRLQLQQSSKGAAIRARNLDIERLLGFSEQLPGITAEQRQQLKTIAPSGRLKKLRLELRDGKVLAAAATLRDFRSRPSGQIPGVQGFSGRIRYDGERAEVELESRDTVVELPRLFDKPLTLQQLQGAVRAERLGEGWRIDTRALAVKSADLDAELDATLQLQPGERPLLAMLGRFRDGRIVAVPDYLPVKIMPEATVRWLSQAFTAGRVDSGRLLLHGYLDKSLMRQQQGRFEVLFDASGVGLDYREGWPKLHDIRGRTRITGMGLELTANQGRFFDSPLAATTVTIRDFRHAVLEVNGTVNASANDALRFLRESPLVAEAGLRQMSGEGVLPVSLKLSIPLSDKVRADSPLRVEGKAKFAGNRLQVAPGVVLQQVEGELSFSENNFQAQSIQAQLYDNPVSITVFTEGAGVGERGATVVAARGRAAADDLRRELGLPLLELAQGESDWQARLTLTPGEQGAMTLDIHSDLDGVELALPAPLGKAKESSRAVTVTLGLGGAEAGIHRLHYAEGLSLSWQRSPDSARLQRMALHLGANRDTPLPKQEKIRVSGRLEALSWRPWRELARRFGGEGDASTGLPLQIDMQRLHLLAVDDADTEGALDEPPQLPPIELAVKSFAYGDLELGRVAAGIVPTKRGLRFDKLQVSAPQFEIAADGSWRFGDKTRFKLDLKSENLGKMLGELGFASVIKDGKTRASGEVAWPGAPTAFSLAALEAKGHVVIKEGAIEEVKPGAGKLLGLLSLQALPRRLFLDFSDLSKKGLQFTKIEGDLKIADGNAYTEDMLLESLPANILVSGRTGLVARDFDQLVMVVPNVSDTVSVAGALAWGPQVAAALVVLQKIFKSDIDAATMTRYTVTGSWEKPVITRLKPLPLQEEPS